jgi:MGT family glycosyltransferase
MAGMKNANFVRANCRAMIDMIADCDADAVVDFWNPFACIAARVLGKPLVTVIQADAHPSNKGLIWWRDPPEDIPTALPTINKVLGEHGLESLSKTEDLNLGDLTLIVGTPETDPVPDATGCAYIGPTLWQQPHSEVPDWFHDLDDSKPVVWAYSGNPRYGSKRTALDSEVVLQACIDVLADLDVRVVLTTGHHALPDEFLPLPSNFQFASYVPGLTMAERCDLMVHHGGYGSCQTGLYSATPAVIIPTFSERESNARRIAALGAGEYVLPHADETGRKRIDLEEFRTKVTSVLSGHTYLENAQRYSELLRAYGGAKKAARLIENVVKGRGG